jgi:hypothetical protein
MFKHEGIYITPDGYFKTLWNPKTRKYNANSLSIEEIETELNEVVYLQGDIRLKHIIQPILDGAIFPILFMKDFWKEMMDEAKNKTWKPWIGDSKLKKDIDGDEIEYLEIYDHNQYDSKRKNLESLPSRWSFHGVGFTFKNEDLAKEYYQKLGGRTNYAIEMLSIADLMNYPLRIGGYSLSKEKEGSKYDQDDLIVDANCPVSLYTLIHSITWELSFCGVGHERDEKKENLNSMTDELEAGKIETVSYSAQSFDVIMAEMLKESKTNMLSQTLEEFQEIFENLDEKTTIEFKEKILIWFNNLK